MSPSTRPVLIVEFDQIELALRIAEACLGRKRPAGLTPAQAMRQMARMDEDMHDGFMRAAASAMFYFKERSSAATPGKDAPPKR
jgi:hypothetical protein